MSKTDRDAKRKLRVLSYYEERGDVAKKCNHLSHKRSDVDWLHLSSGTVS